MIKKVFYYFLNFLNKNNPEELIMDSLDKYEFVIYKNKIVYKD